MNWNPLYEAYAKAHGRTAEGMQAFDKFRWPGGSGTGFILWADQWHQKWLRHMYSKDGRRDEYETWEQENQARIQWIANNGTPLHDNLPIYENIPVIERDVRLGCGKPMHVAGTNGGRMRCGAFLTHIDKSRHREHCEKCSELLAKFYFEAYL